MVFSSVTFLFYFLPLFLVLYFFPRHQKQRNLILFSFSLIFYAWGEPLYISLMLISIAINWRFAKLIDTRHCIKLRKFYLSLAILFNIGALGFFKYIPFVIDAIESQLNIAVPYSYIFKKIPLPIGISFYTFQAISYIIDVYRKRFHYEPSIIVLGTYISMFPQLIAGPIVRFEQIKKELHSSILTYPNIIKGAQLFILGLSSKVLIANTFAKTADHVFSLNAQFLSAPLAWVGAISYLFQIYFDFGGYSVMAIGLGKMLGFTLPINFDRPYISKSITEFWRRWHISLSTWFRDYLYVPLGGNRLGTIATYRNLFIVFVLCGIWHGAGWNFLLWGIYHGAFLVLERSFRNFKIKIPNILAHAYTLLVVLTGWVIFRCESFSQIKYYLLSMAGGSANAVYRLQEIFLPLWLFFLVLACGLSTVKINYEKEVSSERAFIASGTCYLALFTICTIILVCGTHNPFIYFRF